MGGGVKANKDKSEINRQLRIMSNNRKGIGGGISQAIKRYTQRQVINVSKITIPHIQRTIYYR